MVDHAKQWATDRGLNRTNHVHGKEEFRVPTEFKFSHAERERLKTRVSAKAQLEAGPCFSFVLSPRKHSVPEIGFFTQCMARMGKAF